MAIQLPRDETLELLVRWAQVDRQYAWWAAQNYMDINPYREVHLRDQLEDRMKQLKEENESKQIGGGGQGN